METKRKLEDSNIGGAQILNGEKNLIVYTYHLPPGKEHDEWQKAKDSGKQKHREEKDTKLSGSNNATRVKEKRSCNSGMKAALYTTFQKEPEDFDEKISASQDIQ